jgi:hypothetical protein
MKREHYKSFTIEARSGPLRDGGWDAEVHIEKHDSQGVTITPFFLRETFKTEDEAIVAALVSGLKRIDDGFEPPIIPPTTGSF